MSHLRHQQRHNMAPRLEGARLFLHARLASYLGDGVPRNKIANLAQNVELRSRWLRQFVFHACRVAGFKSLSQRILSHFLWDGCETVCPFFSSVLILVIEAVRI
jgi:hypothetical protein